MSNMSYCRFENTYRDLVDCADAIQCEDLREMSNREQDAFVNLIQLAKSLAKRFDDMDGTEVKNYITNINHDTDEDNSPIPQ